MGKISECVYEVIPDEIHSTEQYCDCDFIRNIKQFLNVAEQEVCIKREREHTGYWKQLSDEVLARYPELQKQDIKMLYIGLMIKNKVAIVLSK